MNVNISLEDGRTVSLEPFSGGFYKVYSKDVELPEGNGYIGGFCHRGRSYCFDSLGPGKGSVIYRDVTPD